MTGNHEMFRDTANWVAAFEDVGLTVLRNTSVPLERDGATITLAGVHDLTGEGEWASDPDAALAAPMPTPSRCSWPTSRSQALDLEGRGVDLQLSGHTHGGQMWPISYLVPLQQPMLEGMAVARGHHRRHLARGRGVGAAGPGRGAARGADHHAEAVVSDLRGRRRRRRPGAPGLGVGRPAAARLLRHRVGDAGARRARPVRAAVARGVPVGAVLGDDPAQAPGLPAGLRRLRPRRWWRRTATPTSSG